MPTYQYECESCGHALEAFQSMMDKKLKKCPKCGKNKLSRLIGAGSGMIFKGTGFFVTDYKKKEAPKAEKCADSCAGHSPKTDSTSKKESGSEKKTAETKQDTTK